MSKKKKSDLVEQIKKTSKTASKVKSDIKLLPTGCTLLDLIVGGGWPVGKIVNIVGDKSSGKTYLAIECIAESKKKFKDKLKIFYDNAEAGFSFDTESMYGFEILPESKKRSITVEDFAFNLKSELKKLKKDEYLIYVLDSLDALSSEAEMKRAKEREKALEEGKEWDKGTYAMEKQKFMSEFFRLRATDIEDKNCLLIIISQVRHNIGVMFGEKYVRNGGKALDFYAHTCLWLAEAEKHKKKDRVIGITIKAQTKKSKTPTPFRSGYISLLFDYGVDDITTNINFLYGLKTDTGKDKKKEKIEWDGEEFTKNSLIGFIEDNNLESELRKRVIEKWNEIEDSIKPKRKSKWEG